MNFIKTKGIVLSSIDYKEKDKLINIFSIDYGIITAVLKSVNSEKSKLKACKQPLCFADFVINTPSNVVTSAEVLDTFYDVSLDINKFYCACAILDCIKTVLKPEEINASLFLETLKALGAIAYSGVLPKLILCKFLLDIFEAMGYKLGLEDCSTCGQSFMGKRYLNLDFGEIVCTGCKSYNNIEITPKVHSTFKILNRTEYNNLISLKLSLGSDEECFNVLNQNFLFRFNKKLAQI